jgi:hypothetical protein
LSIAFALAHRHGRSVVQDLDRGDRCAPAAARSCLTLDVAGEETMSATELASAIILLRHETRSRDLKHMPMLMRGENDRTTSCCCRYIGSAEP